jgi:multicomponent K+:H+ antiporter subunit G
MNAANEISALSATLTVTLLIGGAAITLIGSLGLPRLRTFYERIHAPTLGTTLGTTCIALASMIYFSALGARPVLHELLIIVFVTVTTPISLIVLVRAAVFRDQFENEGTFPLTAGEQTSLNSAFDRGNRKNIHGERTQSFFGDAADQRFEES